MGFHQARHLSRDQCPKQGLHLPLIGVSMKRFRNSPWLAWCLAQHDFTGVAADLYCANLGLGERKDLFGLGGGNNFRPLLGEFDEIQGATEPCEDACEKECRPITRHGLTNDAVSARPEGRREPSLPEGE